MYTVYENYVDVVGNLWSGLHIFHRYYIDEHIHNLLVNEYGVITRESVLNYIKSTNTDFRNIDDAKICLDSYGFFSDWDGK